MTPAAAKGALRRQIDQHGETVTLRRVNASPVAPTDVTTLAKVAGYQPEELVAGITTGGRLIIIHADDVDGFPVPFKTGGTDKVIVRGRTLNIGEVDDSSRRLAGVLIGYNLICRG